MISSSTILLPQGGTQSEFELVGHFGGDVLEADGGARDALETHPVERQPWQLAHLNLPLDQRVRVGVAVHTQQQELFALLIVTVVLVENFADLLHYLGRIPRRRCLHAPCETK